jgi:hypothetical protein
MAQCKAHSSRTGRPCRAHAIAGAAICRKHGGAALQVKRKARERLAILVDPAIEELAKLLNSKLDGVRLAAVKDILDRAGYRPVNQIEPTTRNKIQEALIRKDQISWTVLKYLKFFVAPRRVCRPSSLTEEEGLRPTYRCNPGSLEAASVDWSGLTLASIRFLVTSIDSIGDGLL